MNGSEHLKIKPWFFEGIPGYVRVEVCSDCVDPGSLNGGFPREVNAQRIPTRFLNNGLFSVRSQGRLDSTLKNKAPLSDCSETVCPGTIKLSEAFHKAQRPREGFATFLQNNHSLKRWQTQLKEGKMLSRNESAKSPAGSNFLRRKKRNCRAETATAEY